MSVAVTVWEPTVLRVTLTVRVPADNAPLAGSDRLELGGAGQAALGRGDRRRAGLRIVVFETRAAGAVGNRHAGYRRGVGGVAEGIRSAGITAQSDRNSRIGSVGVVVGVLALHGDGAGRRPGAQ